MVLVGAVLAAGAVAVLVLRGPVLAAAAVAVMVLLGPVLAAMLGDPKRTSGARR